VCSCSGLSLRPRSSSIFPPARPFNKDEVRYSLCWLLSNSSPSKRSPRQYIPSVRLHLTQHAFDLPASLCGAVLSICGKAQSITQSKKKQAWIKPKDSSLCLLPRTTEQEKITHSFTFVLAGLSCVRPSSPIQLPKAVLESEDLPHQATAQPR